MKQLENKILILVSLLLLAACGPMHATSSLLGESSLAVSPAGPGNDIPDLLHNTPLEDIATLSDWNSSFPRPVRADDCLTNPKYNLCLTSKDPVTTNGAVFSPAFTIDSATSEQESKVFVYGVKAPTTAPKNNFFQLASELSGATLQLPALTSAGDWKFKYRGDTNHNVAQMHAFYWINYERSYLMERTGMFHATPDKLGSKVTIRSYDIDTPNNAFYSPANNTVTLGYTDQNQGGNKGEMTLELTVALHEVGHADFVAASPNSLGAAGSVQCGPKKRCCPDANGCVGAIHEGQADFHAKMVFHEDGGMQGRYNLNSMNGTPSRNPDAILASNQTAQSIFTAAGGEIHGLGAAYDTIWYYVWKKAKDSGKEQAVERVFMSHLNGLSPSDNFITAYSTIKATAKAVEPAQAAEMIADFKTVYAKLNLDLGANP